MPSDALRSQLQASLELGTNESRLRALIARHDVLRVTIRGVDEQIAVESRRWANAQGLTLRPTIEQLRQHLTNTARPK